VRALPTPPETKTLAGPLAWAGECCMNRSIRPRQHRTVPEGGAMTNIVLTFPLRRAARLRCVWMATGNPAQPLACKWTTGTNSGDGRIEASAGPQPHCKLCA